jgi:hypothetical protein
MNTNEGSRVAIDRLAHVADTAPPGTLPADFDAVIDQIAEALHAAVRILSPRTTVVLALTCTIIW